MYHNITRSITIIESICQLYSPSIIMHSIRMILVFFVTRNTHQFVIPSINNSDMDHERNVSDDTIYIIIYNANLLRNMFV